LKLRYDAPVLIFAFNCNLRHYSKAAALAAGSGKKKKGAGGGKKGKAAPPPPQPPPPSKFNADLFNADNPDGRGGLSY